MSDPTERQVLYALVGLGFHVVVAILLVAAAVAGLVPIWWTAVMAVAWIVVALGAGPHWRQTGRVLGSTIGLFLMWTIGTLVLA